jgi:hypothetical protein
MIYLRRAFSVVHHRNWTAFCESEQLYLVQNENLETKL